MAQMATMAGVSKPVLYAEFGGRNGVAEHLASEFGARIEREVAAGLTDTGKGRLDYETAIRALIEALFSFASEHRELYAFTMRALHPSGGALDNALVTSISQCVRPLWAMVRTPLDPDVEHVSTQAVLGLVFGTLDAWQVTHRPPRRQILDALSAVIIGAMDLLLADVAQVSRARRS